MSIQNLDQVRAQNAWKATRNNEGNEVRMGGKQNGEVVKKIPPMIRENGILGALAFALEEKKDREEWEKKHRKNKEKGGKETCVEAIIAHLKSPGINKSSATSLESFLTELVNADSAKLRDVTAEAMLYLNYLRRFAQKPEKEQGD